MNLTERLRGLKCWTRLLCPLSGEECLQDGHSVPDIKYPCAHYNPETDECIHVEAARAQIRIAKELSVIAQTLECETINIRRRGRS